MANVQSHGLGCPATRSASVSVSRDRRRTAAAVHQDFHHHRNKTRQKTAKKSFSLSSCPWARTRINKKKNRNKSELSLKKKKKSHSRHKCRKTNFGKQPTGESIGETGCETIRRRHYRRCRTWTTGKWRLRFVRLLLLPLLQQLPPQLHRPKLTTNLGWHELHLRQLLIVAPSSSRCHCLLRPVTTTTAQRNKTLSTRTTAFQQWYYTHREYSRVTRDTRDREREKVCVERPSTHTKEDGQKLSLSSSLYHRLARIEKKTQAKGKRKEYNKKKEKNERTN